MKSIHKLIDEIEKIEGCQKIDKRLQFAHNHRITEPQLASKQAIMAYQEACQQKNHPLELRALMIICNTAHYNDDLSDHFYWIDKLAERGKELEHNPSIGRAFVHRSRWAAREGKLMEAANLLKSALDYFDESINFSDMASCHNGIGNIYNELDDLDQALSHYQTARKFAETLSQNTKNLIDQNIALILMRQKEYAQAWSIFDQVLDHVHISDIATRRVVLLNLGHICQKTKELDQAVNYFNEIIKITKDVMPDHFLIRPLCNKAMILSEKCEFPDAQTLIKQAELLAKNNSSDLKEVYYAFSDLYKKWHKPDQESIYIKKIISLLEESLNSQNPGIIDSNQENQHYDTFQKYLSILKKEICELKHELGKLTTK